MGDRLRRILAVLGALKSAEEEQLVLDDPAAGRPAVRFRFSVSAPVVEKKLRASRSPLRMYSNRSPWNAFEPDLVTTLTVAPGCVPKRDDTALVSMLNSWSASGNGNGMLTFDIASVASPPSSR